MGIGYVEMKITKKAKFSKLRNFEILLDQSFDLEFNMKPTSPKLLVLVKKLILVTFGLSTFTWVIPTKIALKSSIIDRSKNKLWF